MKVYIEDSAWEAIVFSPHNFDQVTNSDIVTVLTWKC